MTDILKFAYLIEPPFNYLTEDGAVTGTDVELARVIAQALEIRDIEFIETEFANLLPGVAAGQWRMTTGLFATEERREMALFSNPIWALPDGLLVTAGNPLDLTGYRSIALRPNCKLAVVRGQIQGQTAIELGIPVNRLKIFETYSDAALAIQDGSADAYASVAQAHLGYLAAHPDFGCDSITVPSVEKAPALGCFAFNRNDQVLCGKVNQFLGHYLGSDCHRQLMRSFGFNDGEVDQVLGRAGAAITTV
ncbi:MAG: transporter substrate-binding domain-containing protein [Acidiferrobacterales bacterium]|nr:transporter substrate-binding domain-containing protein [Acidiferrobacterales bacterium]